MKRRTVSLALASLALTASSGSAQVPSLHWQGLVSDVINDPANWLEGVFPDDPPNVVFGPSPTATLQLLSFEENIALNDLRFQGSDRPAYSFRSQAATPPVVSLGGHVTVEAGAPVTIQDSMTVLLVPGLHQFDIKEQATLTLLAPLTGGGGAFPLEKRGGGLLELGGASTFSGGVFVAAGELRLRSSSQGGPVTAGPVGTGPLRLAGGTRLTSAAPDSSSQTVLANELELLGPVQVGQAEESLTLAGLIAGSGSLEILGPVSLLYSGNTYSGETNVNQGQLLLGAPQTLPTFTKVRLAADTRLVVWFDQTIDRLLGEVSSEVELAAGTLTVDFHSNSTNDYFSGTIFGPGALHVANRTDHRIFALDGTAEHTGGTSISSGARFQIGRGGVTGRIAGPIANDGALLFDRQSDAPPLTVPGVISGSGQVVNTSGFTTLAATNTYTGGTTVSGGTLAASAHGAFGSNPIIVHSAATVSLLNGASINNQLNLAPGSTIAGHGGYGQVTIGAGVTLAPGERSHTVGTLRFDDLTLGGGGLYEWNLLGPQSYDQVLLPSATPAFHVAATAANPFVLRLVTLSASGTPGVATGFTDGVHTWTLFDASAGLGGFDTTTFSIDSSAFLTNLGPGDFLLAQSDGLLQLTFTPIPEPSTYLLMLTGLGVVGWRHFRRRRSR